MASRGFLLLTGKQIVNGAAAAIALSRRANARHLLVKRLASGDLGHFWNPSKTFRPVGLEFRNKNRPKVRMAKNESQNVFRKPLKIKATP